jgi:uncharacterized membrane protein YfcA
VLPEFTIAQIGLLTALGVSVGTVGAMVGVGGGFLLVPALLVIFPDAEPAVITSMSLTAVVMNAASATLGYRSRRLQDMRTGMIIVATAVPAAVAGALVTRVTERGVFDLVFGIVLVLGAVYLAIRGRSLPDVVAAAKRGRPRQLIDSSGLLYRYRVNEPAAASIAAGSGFGAAFFGIGGGIVNVPVMMLMLRIPSAIAVATSQLELMLASMAAIIVHLSLGSGDADSWIRGLLLGAGALVGAQIGVRVASHLTGRYVLLILAAGLLMAGGRQIVANVV